MASQEQDLCKSSPNKPSIELSSGDRLFIGFGCLSLVLIAAILFIGLSIGFVAKELTSLWYFGFIPLLLLLALGIYHKSRIAACLIVGLLVGLYIVGWKEITLPSLLIPAFYIGVANSVFKYHKLKAQAAGE